MIPLYRLPGYGFAYRYVQRWLHDHGRCILTRWPRIDSDWRWHCDWCGHHVIESDRTRRLRDTRDEDECLALIYEIANETGLNR